MPEEVSLSVATKNRHSSFIFDEASSSCTELICLRRNESGYRPTRKVKHTERVRAPLPEQNLVSLQEGEEPTPAPVETKKT